MDKFKMKFTPELLRAIGIIACCIGVIVFITLTVTTVKSTQSEIRSVQADILTQEKTLKELETKQEQIEKETPEEISQKLNNISKLGNEVIRYQQMWFDGNFEEATAGLDKLFDDTVTNKYMWYQPNPDDKATWSFRTNYSFAADKQPVLWTCKSKDGELLAYVTGVYDVKKGKFVDINNDTIILTQIGKEHQPLDNNVED